MEGARSNFVEVGAINISMFIKVLAESSSQGFVSSSHRDGIPHGVWFVSYDYCKTVLSSTEISNKEITVPMISGAFAATSAWLVGYPFDLIKTRIQAGNGKGVILTAKDLVNEANGRVIYGLYRGFGLKLLRSIPGEDFSLCPF
jgi:hypothetical protein